MKDQNPTLIIGGSLVLGILLFVLTFNLVRSGSSASTATDQTVATAVGNAAKPAPAQAARPTKSSSSGERTPPASIASDDRDDSADNSTTAADEEEEDSDDPPRRRGFLNPPKVSQAAIREANKPGRSTSRSGVPAPSKRGFTSAGNYEPAEVSPQNPFKRHGSREHWTSYEDATDYVASEIYEAIEDRPTLVVWLLDRTSSAASMRDRVVKRFDSIYQKFEELKTSGHASFADSSSPRLLTVVGTFGQDVEFLTPEPTDRTTELVQAAYAVRDDGSGEEHTFAAIDLAVKQLTKFCSAGRLMMIVVVSDEAGDDDDKVDDLVPKLSKAAIPVYVIGVPAALGLTAPLSGVQSGANNFSKMSTESGKSMRVGPESLRSETVDLGAWGGGNDVPLDSGFGPFALSRLALATGGHYMPVRLISTYDPQKMAEHAPDYVSHAAYDQLVDSNQARKALVEAAKLGHADFVAHFDQNFPKPKDESALKRALDKAQQAAARLEPKATPFYKALAAGESDRNKLTGARWQAEYDLAMGRAAAMRSRVEGYNSALAQLKAGKQFPDPSHSTWVLRATNDVKGDSALEKLAGQASKYLNRVIKEHPGTPWAIIATRELASPLGWEWTSR